MEPSEHGYVDDAAVRVGGWVAASRDLLAQALVGALPVERQRPAAPTGIPCSRRKSRSLARMRSVASTG
jgi:hypothetical protein